MVLFIFQKFLNFNNNKKKNLDFIKKFKNYFYILDPILLNNP